MARKKRRYRITPKLRARYSSLQVNSALRKAGVDANPLSVNRVSASQFHKAITAGKRANKNGWMVDVHSVKEYKGMKCFLTSDGLSGIAIKPDGDVVSVFSAGGGKKMAKLIPFAVANGGRKLDCFGQGLQDLYARYGAKATGRTPFNEEYKPDGWDISKGKPDVVAMTLPSSLDELIKSYKPKAEINMSRVRKFPDYDSMIDDRDMRVAKTRGNTYSALGLSVG